MEMTSISEAHTNPTATEQIQDYTTNGAANMSDEHNHYEGMVHPGITTLVSCLIIALMLAIYLSMGSITSFIRRQRLRFNRGRNLSISNRTLSSIEINEAASGQGRKETVLLQAYKKSSNLTPESSNEMLSCFGNALSKDDTTTDIRSAVESSSKDAKSSQSSDEFQVITPTTLVDGSLYGSTEASLIEAKTSKLKADDHNNNQPKEVEMPLIPTC